MDDAPALSLSATFPPPPAHHALFTPANLALLKRLQQEAADGEARASAATEEDERLVSQLEPPRLDWIEQAGGFQVFGDFYPIPTHVPTVTEMGVTDLMPTTSAAASASEETPASPPSPAEALRRLLLAYLTTFSALVRALGRPPPPLPTKQAEADAWRPGLAEVGRLAEVGVNMLVRVNELRGEQAKATLEGLLEAQIARRRTETQTLSTRCAELRATLEAVRAPFAPPANPSTSSLGSTTASASTLVASRRALEQAVLNLDGSHGGSFDGVGDGASSGAAATGELERTERERAMLEVLDSI